MEDQKDQGDLKGIHIGLLIKERMQQRGLSVPAFARLLHYERTNIYKIFKRSSIDIDLLLRISEVLQYDFLREVYLKEAVQSAAEASPRYSLTIEVDEQELQKICGLLHISRTCE